MSSSFQVLCPRGLVTHLCLTYDDLLLLTSDQATSLLISLDEDHLQQNDHVSRKQIVHVDSLRGIHRCNPAILGNLNVHLSHRNCVLHKWVKVV